MKFFKTIVAFLTVCMLFTFLVACGDGGSSQSKFEQFENGLVENNIQFEINPKAAAMVGAKEGYGYIFSDGTSVELYLFDTSTKAYKDSFKTNKLNLESFGITFDVIFNGDICIYFNGEPTEKTVITNIFNDLK